MTNKDFQPTAPKYFFAEKAVKRFIKNKAVSYFASQNEANHHPLKPNNNLAYRKAG
jgi:hypothetical protein